jgi:hypothetical protein
LSVLPVGFGSAAGGTPTGAVERSLRFNSADNAQLNRTFGTPTNNKIFTISAWVKTTSPSATLFDFSLLSVGDAGSIGIAGSGAYGATVNNRIFIRNGTVTGDYWLPVFRDVSAWYHFVIAIDTTQATQADRAKLWVNGVSQAANKGASTLGLNATMSVNAASTTHYIGGIGAAGYYANGYLAEYNFVDGQALTPSSFGETDAATGVWKPKAYTGTYGTNGFELNFSDNSNTTAATLGKDYSGNGNNWTPNNFSVTAGAGNDSMVDSPTAYGTDTGVGGEVRGNYATLNLLKRFTANVTLSNGNLTASDGSTTSTSAIATINLPTSGKWYWEVTVSASVASGIFIGACPEANAYGTAVVQTNGSYRNNGTIYNTASATQTSGATYTTNDVIGVAVDVDNGTVQFYKNGVAQGATPSFSFTALSVLVPFIATDNASGTKTVNCNFGQTSFLKWNGSAFVANTAPSGFKALCTQNFTTPTIGATSTTQANDYFDVKTWSGNSSTQSIALEFAPGLIWNKSRSGAAGHSWWDVLRGTGAQISSSETDAETTGYNAITSFSSNAISLGADNTGTYNGRTNETGRTYVGWVWNAGGSNQTISVGQYSTSPNVPSIASTVRANTTSGFSIVTYTGNGSSNQTVGHGLGVTPSMIILKDRDTNGSNTNWFIYHTSLTANNNLFFTTGAQIAITGLGGGGIGTSPTGSVFTLANGSSNNQNVNQNTQRFVAYCFAPVAGYSAFGSYTGNGSADGPFVYTGFRPAYVLIKYSSGTADWIVLDETRPGYNVIGGNLYPNASFAEDTQTKLDILSNGFKIRADSSNANVNVTSGTYIYAAFAEFPFKYALAR